MDTPNTTPNTTPKTEAAQDAPLWRCLLWSWPLVARRMRTPAPAAADETENAAAAALAQGTPRSGLSMAAQLAYDRLSARS